MGNCASAVVPSIAASRHAGVIRLLTPSPPLLWRNGRLLNLFVGDKQLVMLIKIGVITDVD